MSRSDPQLHRDVQIGRSGKHIGQEAVQLHGGIGMTMEYKVGHYFKRMTMLDKLFGDADAHGVFGLGAVPSEIDVAAHIETAR